MQTENSPSLSAKSVRKKTAKNKKISSNNFPFLSPLCNLLAFTRSVCDFANKPITSKNSDLDKGKLTWTFFAYICCFVFTEFGQLFCKLSFAQIFHPLSGILTSFVVFISAKCCGSFNKFTTHFLWSLDSSLLFHWIFYKYFYNPTLLFFITIIWKQISFKLLLSFQCFQNLYKKLYSVSILTIGN